MIKLSVVIITLNEEKNIKRCIESVKNVADEILIIDSFSTDKTKEIAVALGARFITHAFEGHIEQKNYSLTQTTFTHVLSLDADEALSDQLKKSILAVKSNWQADGYSFSRLSSYCGTWIKYGGWYPDRKLRLFNKTKGNWHGSNPHDKFILNDDSSHKNLEGDLLHYTYHTIQEHIKQVNYFTDIGAYHAYREGKRSNLFKIIFASCFKFIKSYFLQLGILDGYYGFIIACISSHATFLKYVKLQELQKSNKKIS